MLNIIIFIKRFWYIFVFIFLVLMLVIFVVLQNKKISTISGPSPSPQLTSYKNVIPGKTTLEELKSQLGSPVEISNQGNLQIYKYPSQFTNYPSQFFVSSDKVNFVIEPVKYEEKRNIQDYLNEFGQPDKKLYNPNLGPAIPGYLYLSKGVIAFAHDADGTLIEVWYFEPTTLANFMNTWGKDLVTKLTNHPE